jgi:hypothetical protein
MMALQTLARVFDKDKHASIQSYLIPTTYDATEGQSETLVALVSFGYVEAVKGDDGLGHFDFTYRLTENGRVYYDEMVVPRLPPYLH